MRGKHAKTRKDRRGHKESFMQGVLALMFSQVLIKLLGLVYKLYLTNKEGFGDAGNAIYSSGFQIYALLLTLSSIGVPNAISKLVSEKESVGDHKGAHRIFKIAFVLFAFVGLIGTLLLFFGAHHIAYNWLQIPDAELTLVALSPSIFFVAVASVIRGYFSGRENLKVTANSQTLEQIFKTFLTILIVEIVAMLSKVNTVYMAAGATLATTLATFLSFGYLYLYYTSEKKEIREEIRKTTKRREASALSIAKKILMVSIPISLSSIMSSINKNIDSFTVVAGLKNFMSEEAAMIQYGILGGKVDTLTSLPLSFNIAFATALVPAIASAMTKNDMETAEKRLSFSLLVTMLIGLPCTIGMALFSGPILELLFPNATEGTLLLQISSFTILFTVLEQTINGALQGLGKVMVPAIALGVGVLAKLVCNLVLVPIPSIGAAGAAMGSVVCHMVACAIVFIVIRRSIRLKLGFSKFIVKPVLATIMMGICSYAIYFVLTGILPGKLVTIIALCVAVIIYVLALIALKIFTKEEIFMIPYGQKIYAVLTKLGLYKEPKKA